MSLWGRLIAINTLRPSNVEAEAKTEKTSVVPITEIKSIEMFVGRIYTRKEFFMVRKHIRRQGLYLESEKIIGHETINTIF